MEDVIIAGRGKSIETFEFPPGMPICAVSSGVFAKALPRDPDYWCCLDAPRYFVKSDKQWFWKTDPRGTAMEWWDACYDKTVAKHVPAISPRGHPLLDIFAAAKDHNQPDPTLPNPMWRELPNVHTWSYAKRWPVHFGEGVLGGKGVGSSLTFALQVMWKMGFRRARFAGVDLVGPQWRTMRRALNWFLARSPMQWPVMEDS